MSETQLKSQLTDLEKGNHAFVLSLGSGKAITRRLTSLGFTPGVEIVMTQNYGYGPLVVTVRGTRVALGRQEALDIQVQRNIE